MREVGYDLVLYREYPIRDNPICISNGGEIYRNGLFFKRYLSVAEIPKDVLKQMLKKLNKWQNDLTYAQEKERQIIEQELENWKKPKNLRRRKQA